VESRSLADVGENDFRRIEVLIVVAGSEFPPVVALVLTFAERFGEIAEVARDGWMLAGRRFRVIEALDDVPEEFIVNVQGQGQFVRDFVATLLGFEMEEARVVAGVGLLKYLAKAGLTSFLMSTEGRLASRKNLRVPPMRKQ
jgi:hypothetical protein